MTRTALDPKTLRWVSRKLRAYEKQQRALPEHKDRFEQGYKLGRCHSYVIAADLVLRTAKAIERK